MSASFTRAQAAALLRKSGSGPLKPGIRRAMANYYEHGHATSVPESKRLNASLRHRCREKFSATLAIAACPIFQDDIFDAQDSQSMGRISWNTSLRPVSISKIR